MEEILEEIKEIESEKMEKIIEKIREIEKDRIKQINLMEKRINRLEKMVSNMMNIEIKNEEINPLELFIMEGIKNFFIEEKNDSFCFICDFQKIFQIFWKIIWTTNELDNYDQYLLPTKTDYIPDIGCYPNDYFSTSFHKIHYDIFKKYNIEVKKFYEIKQYDDKNNKHKQHERAPVLTGISIDFLAFRSYRFNTCDTNYMYYNYVSIYDEIFSNNINV